MSEDDSGRNIVEVVQRNNDDEEGEGEVTPKGSLKEESVGSDGV